jgi:DNA-3-methyladenine glycosylase
MAPDLIVCLVVNRQASGELLWGLIVQTEAYSQDDPACHGYRRRLPCSEMLLGAPGLVYVEDQYS